MVQITCTALNFDQAGWIQVGILAVYRIIVWHYFLYVKSSTLAAAVR